MNLFSKKKPPSTILTEYHPEMVDEIVLSNNKIVEEIHETFMTEVDRLLAEAKIFRSIETTKGHLIDKAQRLKAFGFHAATESIEGTRETIRLQRLEMENSEKEILIKAIEYFSSKYPQYKFITEVSIKSICEKYGLVFGDVKNYTGVVPDENLEHIEQFKIEKEDGCYYKVETYGPTRRPYVCDYHSYIAGTGIPPAWRSAYVSYEQAPLEIAAPLSHFNMKDKEVQDYKIVHVIKDPVVFQPVSFCMRKFYLIVTAWGK